MRVAVSSAALLTIVIHLLRVGAAPQADEGAAAHIWQLLMVAQLPVVAPVAIFRWSSNFGWWERVSCIGDFTCTRRPNE